MQKRTLDPAIVRRLSAAAYCDPRTVRKFLRGEPVAGLCASRIRAAIERGEGERPLPDPQPEAQAKPTA